MAKLKKHLIRILIILVILVGVLVGVTRNPRVKLLVSVLLFSETTLKSDAYIAHNIDIMDLFVNYMNSDTKITGKVSLNDIQNFNFSSSMTVTGYRSFEQKKMSALADMKVGFLEVGDMDAYADNSTIYLVVPMLDNLAYAFDTGDDLFLKAPELTSDLSNEWFRDNYSNIIELMGQIEIEKTGDFIQDGHLKSYEYVITIPKGTGEFIWELLGMDPPDYDISISMYLDPFCRNRRIEMSLDDILSGASLTIDGLDMSTLVFTKELPDDEKIVMTCVRNANYNYTNYMDIDCIYYSHLGYEITATMYLTWESFDDYTTLQVKNIEMKKGEELICRARFNGVLEKYTIRDDVFGTMPVEMSSFEHRDWKEVRDDTESFVNEMMDEVKRRTGLDI